jgi:hypothetical protein
MVGVSEDEMILYHFTSVERIPLIQAAGFLRVTESNIGSGRPDWPPYGEHAGPDVVWLTNEPEPDKVGLGVGTVDGSDETLVRITVDIADGDVMWWPDFRTLHGIHPRWRRALEKGRNPDSWWVVSRNIVASEFVAVA